MVFPCMDESWTIKKAESQRIGTFKLWCWRRLLRAPWTARRPNQSILKEICPQCSLEGLMLKLKLQYFVHLIGRTDSLEKTLMPGKIEDRGRRGWQRMRWLDDIIDLMDMSLSKLECGWWTGKPGVLQSMGLQIDMTEQLNWTEADPLCLLLKGLLPRLHPFMWSSLPKNSKFPPDPVIHTSKGDSTNFKSHQNK